MKSTQLSVERFVSLTRDVSLRSSFQLISWRRARRWRHPISWRALGLIDSQPTISLKGTSSWPLVNRGKEVGVLQWPRPLSFGSPVAARFSISVRHAATQFGASIARASTFFYRRLRERDAVSRRRHAAKRQRGLSDDEREALLPLKTDTTRAARSARAALKFALSIHRPSMKLRIFSVRQIGPVGSPLYPLPGAN